MNRQTDLLLVIRTHRTASSLASRLNRRNKQSHKHANDGNHHQQLD
jgi:hypothetical protein